MRWYTTVRDLTDIHVTGARVAYPTAHAALAAIAARRACSGATAGGTVATAAACDAGGQDVKLLLPPAAAVSGAAGGTSLAVKVEEPAGAVTAAESGAAAPAGAQTGTGLPITADIKAMPGVPAAAPTVASLAGDAPCDCHGQADAAVTVGSSAAAPAARAASAGGCCAHPVAGVTTAVCESCVITVRFMGYLRVHQGSGQVFDAIDLFLPDTQFETQVGSTACRRSQPKQASYRGNEFDQKCGMGRFSEVRGIIETYEVVCWLGVYARATT